MGLPSINISFTTAAAAAIARSTRGVVAIIIRVSKSADAKGYTFTSPAQIPEGFTADNKAYIERAFRGYINPPRMVIVYGITTGSAFDEALAYMALQQFDWLALPSDVTQEECISAATWVTLQRANGHLVKAVLPAQPGDNEGIVNFTASGIKVGSVTHATAAYCSRIAGLLAGTPLTISCTYAPLPEITDIARLTKSELDAAVDKGELVLFHDGVKVKIGRGANSLQTTTQDKGAIFKKIKIVEAVDLITTDISTTAQDNYIGKYANSYDNKCLLITAIQGYFKTLEVEGVLKGGSTVGIDMTAQEAYLISTGIDTSKMSEPEIKEADTGDKVFLTATIKIIDAIEDISLKIII